jgi:hypothetical protein
LGHGFELLDEGLAEDPFTANAEWRDFPQEAAAISFDRIQ